VCPSEPSGFLLTRTSMNRSDLFSSTSIVNLC
jgi:hypothetical protein